MSFTLVNNTKDGAAAYNIDTATNQTIINESNRIYLKVVERKESLHILIDESTIVAPLTMAQVDTFVLDSIDLDPFKFP
jgi:hypothetical protein